MTLTATIAASLNDWLSSLATSQKALLGRGAKRFATLVSPHAELERVGSVEQGSAPVVTLTVMSGLHRGASMALRSDEYLIGSGPDCDIALRDRAIRPHHCRLTREWFGFSILELGAGNTQQIAPQTVNYQQGEIEAIYDIGGLTVSLRQPPPPREQVTTDPLSHARRSWILPAAIAASLVAAIAIFVLVNPGTRRPQPPIESRIAAGNLALVSQGFGTVHFRRDSAGRLEIVGLVTDIAERKRLSEWLRHARYDDAHPVLQPVSELLEQARRALAADELHIDVGAGGLRITGTTSQLAVKERIRTLAEDLRGTVAVEDHVSYVDARQRSSPAPAFPVRLRGVMVGNPSYFLTDQGARYFVGGVLPDGAEVLAIDARQIRFAVAGKVIVYNLE